MNKLPIVGVMGSGSRVDLARAEQLGSRLAALEVNLLTGGGGGAMAAVSKAFFEVAERSGKVIGVLPAAAENPTRSPTGYPNPWVEVVIRTHLPLSGERGTEPMSRNHINVLSSDAIVVLPGSAGTVSEARLAQRYGRPIIGFLETDEMRTLSDIERSASIDDVLTFVRRITARPGTP